ncbi:hypothetical protein QTP88_018333 [Uroleucon formosanum]
MNFADGAEPLQLITLKSPDAPCRMSSGSGHLADNKFRTAGMCLEYFELWSPTVLENVGLKKIPFKKAMYTAQKYIFSIWSTAIRRLGYWDLAPLEIKHLFLSIKHKKKVTVVVSNYRYTVARVDSLINRTRLYVETYKRRNAGIPNCIMAGLLKYKFTKTKKTDGSENVAQIIQSPCTENTVSSVKQYVAEIPIIPDSKSEFPFPECWDFKQLS